MIPLTTVRASEFTVNQFSKPSLCLGCKKNDIEEWDDDRLYCMLVEQQNESADFICKAYEPIW